MASNKNNLNFDELIQVIFQSSFTCVFCNAETFEVYSESISIEHCENQNCDREDISKMVLAHTSCNRTYKEAKNYDVQAQLEKNKIQVLPAMRKEIIKTLVKYNPQMIEKLAPKAVCKVNNWTHSGSRAVSNSQYAEIKNAELELENEKLQDEIYKNFEEIKAKFEKAKNEMHRKDLDKFLK